MSQGALLFAAGAIVFCLAARKQIKSIGKEISNSINWLSIQGQKEFEKLEQELTTPVKCEFMDDIQDEFFEQYQRVKSQILKYPTLKSCADEIAKIKALEHSSLGQFVKPDHWEQMKHEIPNSKSFNQVIQDAINEQKIANRKYIKDSIIKVANDNGFCNAKIIDKYENSGTNVIILNHKGQGIVTKINDCSRGANVSMHLTGFTDGSCKVVMDNMLKGLNERQIRLKQIVRHPKYQMIKKSRKQNYAENNEVQTDHRHLSLHQCTQKVMG